MKSHTDLINRIAKKIGAKNYLEIGVYNPDHNFNKIEIVSKVGVDPDPAAGATVRLTSDVFFATLIPGIKLDIVFIDGLHHSDQVKKDIINSWVALRPGGVIVLHDCNPPSEKTTCVPRGAQREWCGDVYKAVSAITWPEKFTVDFDYGCMVIRKPGTDNDPIIFDYGRESDLNEHGYKFFDENRVQLLNLVSVEDAMEIIESWT